MIERNTCFVLGAGASVPYGLPDGKTLLFQMCDSLRSGNQPIASLLRDLGYSVQKQGEFAKALLLSGQSSVDAFLENRPEHVGLGKAAIAAALIPCEQTAKLRRNLDKSDWYEYLFQQLGARRQDFSRNSLSVITLNYDRSLEYYLLTTLIHSYGIGRDEAAKVLTTIPIVHVHGQLGKPDFADAHGRPYSPDVTQHTIKKCVAEIQIVHEVGPTTRQYDRARALIAEAEVLCFLGFGYHPNNLARLNVNEHFKGRGQLYGSCYGMESAERARATGRFTPALYGQARSNFGDSTADALTFLRRYRVFG